MPRFFQSRGHNNVYPCKPQFYHIKVGFKIQNYIGTFCDDVSDFHSFVCSFFQIGNLLDFINTTIIGLPRFFQSRGHNNVYPCKPQFYHIKVGFKIQNYIGTFCDDVSDFHSFVCSFFQIGNLLDFINTTIIGLPR